MRLALTLILATVTLACGGSNKDALLSGIPDDQFDGSTGTTVTRADPSQSTALTPDDAEEIAARTYPGGSAREVVLVEVEGSGISTDGPRLAWAVNFDPDTIAGSPPMGCFEDCRESVRALWAVVFVDAETGEFIFAADTSTGGGSIPVGESFGIGPASSGELKPPDGDSPAAGICGNPTGREVTFEFHPDILSPRCSKVLPTTTLAFVNRTANAVEFELGAFAGRLKSGEALSSGLSVSEFLAPGVHIIKSTAYGSAGEMGGSGEVWLVDGQE